MGEWRIIRLFVSAEMDASADALWHALASPIASADAAATAKRHESE